MALALGSTRRTSDFARIAPSGAGDIVRQIIPTFHRADILSTIADSIEIADEADSSNWGIRLNRTSIMLKVGFVGVLWLGRDGRFHEVVHKKLVSANLRSNRLIRFQKEPFAHAPGCEIITSDFSKCLKIYRTLRPAHESAVQIAARSQRQPSTVRDHSRGLVQFISRELGRWLPQPSYRSSVLEAAEITKIKSSKTLCKTTRKALLDARIGQGQFRKSLLDEWAGCAVTGCKLHELLRASHIKPWSKSNNCERLDRNNGLLLTANLDAAFENGLITFSGSGKVEFSPDLSKADRRILGIADTVCLRNPPSTARRKYLQWHKRFFGFAGEE